MPIDEQVLLWTVDDVVEFFVELDFSAFAASLRDNGITGDLLVHIDHEALRDLGFHSLVSDDEKKKVPFPFDPHCVCHRQGSRLRILRAVYDIKVRDNVPIEHGHWYPPCMCAAIALRTWQNLTITGFRGRRRRGYILGEPPRPRIVHVHFSW
jgi:hypothetical protein